MMFAATVHVPWALNIHQNAFAAELLLRLLAANVVLFLLNEIYKLKLMWLFLNVLYVTV